MTALKIIAYWQPIKTQKGGKRVPHFEKIEAQPLPFEVQFNPESITVTASKRLSDKQLVNKRTDSIEFVSHAPKSYNFTLFLDGTGASGKEKWDVGAKVAEFMKLTYYQKNKEQGNSFLSISWGNFLIYCILESVTVTYKMFDPQGLPIRATLACNFVEYFAGEDLELAQTDWKGPTLLQKLFTDPNESIAAAKEKGANGLRGAANNLSESFNVAL